MIYTATFSKPTPEVEKSLGKAYQKIKIKLQTASGAQTEYFAEMFTEKQVFHQKMTAEQMDEFITQNAGTTFKNCVVKTDVSEITYLANKKGKITRLEKKIDSALAQPLKYFPPQKQKNYLLQEGVPVPFLVMLGVMTDGGKIISSKYDKFRQINRFLEFIDDVLPEIRSLPVRIADFGCGKSYLTFAVHYFLTEVKHIPCEIEGLDLKKDVIDYCNKLVNELNLQNIHFSIGDISAYSGKNNPNIVITLHACDTATDYALKYAVSRNAKVILSIPCCQHEINQQLQEKSKSTEAKNSNVFDPLLKWGIIREKFSSLVTDAIRGDFLETQGYSVQMLEFIDIEHTPKNIMIRAVKKDSPSEEKIAKAQIEIDTLTSALGVNPTITQTNSKTTLN